MLSGISSMAMRPVLADLAVAYRAINGVDVAIQSVGGVEATRRVKAGEEFDVILLASEAIDHLIACGQIVVDSRVDVACSRVAVAVRSGTRRPDIRTEEALRDAVLAARSVGYSTGPSGTHLLRLFERWGLSETLKSRARQAAPGVPVGRLIADGECELGFQQLSELMGIGGVEVVGTLPPGAEFVTTFSAGLAMSTPRARAATTFMKFLASPAASESKRRYGMEPAA